MTNSQYGNYQTPSSRPPEPPYRAGSKEGVSNAQTEPMGQAAPSGYGQEISRADLSGFAYSGYDGGVPGTTDRMPRVQGGGGASEPETDKQESAFGLEQAPAYDEGAQQSQQAYQARQSQQAYQPSSFEARPYAAASAAPAKKSGGAGKSFLFGFLGALLACAIALGGFFALNGNAKTESTASTLVGTQDSSVINAVEEGQTLAEAVAAKALPSVVAVYNYQKQASSYGYGYGYGYGNSSDGDLTASGMGSGVVISEDGYILTNYHVVEDADKITITVDGAEREATYVGGDSSSDVAVVKVEDTEGLTPADIGDSDNLVIGEWVMTVGAPLGLEQSVATGVVSATNRSTIMDNSSSSDYYGMYSNATPEYTYYPNMIQTDAVINPGNSGGALVDADGKLIGINTMISSYSGDYAGVGFAIPVNYAIGIAEQIIEGKNPTHAMLGVSISSVNSQTAKRYNLSTDQGAYIAAITPGTGAADSDLKVGDIITAIDDKAITSTTDVTLDVREHAVGDTVKVTVNRDGETKDIDVVLSSDENVSSSSEGSDSSNNSGNGSGNGYGYGNGYGRGQGGSGGQSIEDILRMLGM